jgi:hypothetical protein
MTSYTAHAAATLLMFVVLPVWIAAGLADYFCHRASRIAETSGVRESLLHLLQFLLIGLPVVLALFLRVNAGLFLLMAICILLHHAAAYVDVRYANSRREVTPLEQMIHSFLEVIPIAAFLLLAVLYWPQLQALFGMGGEPARFVPEPQPLSPLYIVSILCSAFLFNLLPYLEELWRCLRFDRRETADAR